MINKNKFSIRNTKKVLHKVGKQWVVVSAVLLGLVAGGVAVTNANADTTANASQQEVSQAPSNNASNVAKPASKAVLGATAAPASTARLGNLNGKKTAAKNFLQNHKNLVNDAEDVVDNHVKPNSGNATQTSASNAYNDLINFANTDNVNHFLSGASLGSNADDTNPSTWIGAFNTARSAANAINANNPSAKVTRYLRKLNTLYNKTLSISKSVPVSYLENRAHVNIPTDTSLNYSYNNGNGTIPNNKVQGFVYPELTSAIKNALGDKLNNVSKISALAKIDSFNQRIEDFNGLINPINKKINKLSGGYVSGITPLNKINKPSVGTIISVNPTVTGNVNLGNNVQVAINTPVKYILNHKDIPITLSDSIDSNSVRFNMGTNINGNAINSLKSHILESLNAFNTSITNTITSINVLTNNSFVKNNPLVEKSLKLVKTLDGIKAGVNTEITRINNSNFYNDINSKIPNNNDLTNTLKGEIPNNLNKINLLNSIDVTLPLPKGVSLTPNKQQPSGEYIYNLGLPDNYSANEIANLLDGTDLDSVDQDIHDRIINKLGTKANKAAAIIRSAQDIIDHQDMETDYNNILSALKVLPNAQNEPRALQTLGDASDSLANGFSQYPISQYNQSIVNYLKYTAKNAHKSANNANNGNTPKPLTFEADIINYYLNDNNNPIKSIRLTGVSGPISFSDLAYIKGIINSYSGYHLNERKSVIPEEYNNSTYDIYLTKGTTPVNPTPTPTPNPQPSNPTDNNVPYIAPDNFASSVAAQMNGNSASTKSNASTSANTSVVPEKHAANYAKVIKTLQLHTSPNFTKRNGVAVIKPGTVLNVEKMVQSNKGLRRYEVRYNNKNYFITANKHMVNAYYKAAKHVNYRYTKVTKALQLHTNAKFTKRNGVKVVKPGTELRIDNVVKNHGLARYEVRYQGHNYFITANSHFTVNAYLQKSDFSKRGYKAVRAIKSVNSYRHATFSKRGLVRHFRRGTVLPVRRVLTIGNGEVTRLQLTNGRYVSANKDFVEPIR